MMTEGTEKQQNPKKEDKTNIIFIGNKPIINYVRSISIQLKESPEVIIKARGKFISKAVDIVEVAKRSENTQFQISDIQIGTEEYNAKDSQDNERKIKVSTMDVILKR